jgi:protein arginine kinase activator
MPVMPLMGMVLDAAFEIVGRAMSLAEPSCPVCGILRDEYRKRSRLGCPACYKAFEKELDTAVFELHRASQHVGKTPATAKAAWQRQQLENALSDAVKNQRYEEAIALRDQLKKLEPSDGKQGGCA